MNKTGNTIFAAMSGPNLLIKYVRYLLMADTKYSVHSPFVTSLIADVIEDKREFYAFDEIEFLRRELLMDNTTIDVEDFGAGSRISKSSGRKISEIAANSLITPKFGRLLFRLADWQQPETIIELGTSLGISALYLAKACPKATIISLEGSENIATRAKENLARLHTDNVQVITGEFSKTLEPALRAIKKIDLAFIDGNHRYQPTVDYFLAILPFTTQHSILIFDDIHWSAEMEAAWKFICDHASVCLSIDLFFKGIIFFDHGLHNHQHFILRA